MCGTNLINKAIIGRMILSYLFLMFPYLLSIYQCL